MAHWTDVDELELEYHVPGEVEDQRVDSGYWEVSPLAESGTGTDPDTVWLEIKNRYEAEVG